MATKEEEQRQQQSSMPDIDPKLAAALADYFTNSGLASEAALAGAGDIAGVAGAVPAGAAATPFFSLSHGGLLAEGAMPVGNYIPGIAGAIGAYDLFSNKKHGTSGAAQGALSGAGIGFTVGGPVGAGIGAGVGGLAGYFGNFGDENRFQTEYNKADALRKKGVNWDLSTEKPQVGRSKEQLIAEEKAKIDAGKYGNVKFAESRNESDLAPEDIWGYAAWGEQFGDKWLKGISEQQRKEIAQKALDSGLVREHHGTIDINFTPELLEFANQRINNPATTPSERPSLINEGRKPKRKRKGKDEPIAIQPAKEAAPTVVAPSPVVPYLSGAGLTPEEYGKMIAEVYGRGRAVTNFL